MTKIKAFFILGLFVAVLPFLGFPGTWKLVMSVIAGLIIMLLSYSLQSEIRAMAKHEAELMEEKEHRNQVPSTMV